MQQVGRSYSAVSGYRYGFNGKEKDNEVKGEGNQQDYGMRIYDPRLGRFLSVDPLTDNFPYYTPYQFAGNTPIQAIDMDGGEPEFIIDKNGKLTKPMIALYNSAFGYHTGRMKMARWVKANTPFSAQTLFVIILYDKENAEQGKRSYNVWVDYWLNLSVHEHKHRDEYNIFEWPSWGFKYILEIARYDKDDGAKDGYAKNGPSEQRAYPMEDPMVELMNFQNSLALKVLESDKGEFSDKTKAGIMTYVGISFRLQNDKKSLASLKDWIANHSWSNKAKRQLDKLVSREEKKIEKLSKKADALKSKYGDEIEKLDKKQGRKVEKVDNKEKLNKL